MLFRSGGEVRPGGETCDGADNDCNGAVDDAPGVNQPCSNGIGECAQGGVRVCDAQRGVLVCNAQPGQPGVETCDGLDNDCDGNPDDDINLMTDVNNCGRCSNPCAYPNAAGVCEGGACHLGDCQAGWNNVDRDNGNGCEYACIPSNGGVETCDNIDNDCDGEGDEDFDTTADPQNCGACGHVCELAHAEIGRAHV